MADAAAAALLDAARAETQAANAAASDLETQLARSEAAKARLEAAVGLAARESAQLHGQVDEARETLELCRLDLEAALLEKESEDGALAVARRSSRAPGDDHEAWRPLARHAVKGAERGRRGRRRRGSPPPRPRSAPRAWTARGAGDEGRELRRAWSGRYDGASLERRRRWSGRNSTRGQGGSGFAAQVATRARRDLADELDGA
ncbi:hypothetical protein JL721_12031 [Aureococcus anophagefferens]|nr:hypothetical protein JL721_12031 [Aureococcus anophagefferens]